MSNIKKIPVYVSINTESAIEKLEEMKKLYNAGEIDVSMDDLTKVIEDNIDCKIIKDPVKEINRLQNEIMLIEKTRDFLADKVCDLREENEKLIDIIKTYCNGTES